MLRVKRVWRNNDDLYDPYVVIFDRLCHGSKNSYASLAIRKGMSGDWEYSREGNTESHYLGYPIPFTDLPMECQAVVEETLRELNG